MGKIKKIAVGLCVAIICSMLLVVADAILMLKFNLKDSVLVLIVGITYFISCFCGGFISGKMSDSKKYIGGLCCGVLYFLLLVLIAALLPGRIPVNVMHVARCLIICMLGGCVGGMVST